VAPLGLKPSGQHVQPADDAPASSPFALSFSLITNVSPLSPPPPFSGFSLVWFTFLGPFIPSSSFGCLFCSFTHTPFYFTAAFQFATLSELAIRQKRTRLS